MSEDQDWGEHRPVDDDGGVRFRPPITRTTRALPFDQLRWDEFKRLCLMLLPREGFESPRHYSAADGEQGRGIVARRDGKWRFA